jgi:glycosyltransferase involved in cell wall biosynthesis
MHNYSREINKTNSVNEQWICEQFKKDLVSIILPTYNRADLIEEALNSVWAQSYRPIELIIIDDGSTDDTRQIVQNWSCKLERDQTFHLRYYYQKNAGASAARNFGLINCSGEYIQFLDSDDLLHPERIERLVCAFKESSCDFIQTGFEGFCSKCGKTVDRHYGKEAENQLILALEGRLWANTLRSAFRRSLIRVTGAWDEKMTCFEDYDYVVRALLHSSKSIAIRDILASARRGGGNRVSDRLKSREGREQRIHCEEHLTIGINGRNDISTEAKRALASRLYALGFRCKARGWRDLGEKCGELADSIDVELDKLGKRRRMVWILGKWAGRIYKFAHRIKKDRAGKKQQWHINHKCLKNH